MQSFLEQVEKVARGGQMAATRWVGLGAAVVGFLGILAVGLENGLKALERMREPNLYHGGGGYELIFFLGIPLLIQIVLGLRAFVRSRDGKRHPVYQVLRDQPQAVTSIKRVHSRGTGQDLVYFLDKDQAVIGDLVIPSSYAAEFVADTQRNYSHISEI